MIKVFMPGSKVPEWLEKVKATGIDGEERFDFTFTFSGLTAVWSRDGSYKVRAIIGGADVMIFKPKVKGAYFEKVVINGQSPFDGGGPVEINCQPILRWSNFIILAACFCYFKFGV